MDLLRALWSDAPAHLSATHHDIDVRSGRATRAQHAAENASDPHTTDAFLTSLRGQVRVRLHAGEHRVQIRHEVLHVRIAEGACAVFDVTAGRTKVSVANKAFYITGADGNKSWLIDGAAGFVVNHLTCNQDGSVWADYGYHPNVLGIGAYIPMQAVDISRGIDFGSFLLEAFEKTTGYALPLALASAFLKFITAPARWFTSDDQGAPLQLQRLIDTAFPIEVTSRAVTDRPTLFRADGAGLIVPQGAFGLNLMFGITELTRDTLKLVIQRTPNVPHCTTPAGTATASGSLRIDFIDLAALQFGVLGARGRHIHLALGNLAGAEVLQGDMSRGGFALAARLGHDEDRTGFVSMDWPMHWRETRAPNLDVRLPLTACIPRKQTHAQGSSLVLRDTQCTAQLTGNLQPNHEASELKLTMAKWETTLSYAQEQGQSGPNTLAARLTGTTPLVTTFTLQGSTRGVYELIFWHTCGDARLGPVPGQPLTWQTSKLSARVERFAASLHLEMGSHGRKEHSIALACQSLEGSVVMADAHFGEARARGGVALHNATRSGRNAVPLQARLDLRAGACVRAYAQWALDVRHTAQAPMSVTHPLFDLTDVVLAGTSTGNLRWQASLQAPMWRLCDGELLVRELRGTTMVSASPMPDVQLAGPGRLQWSSYDGGSRAPVRLFNLSASQASHASAIEVSGQATLRTRGQSLTGEALRIVTRGGAHRLDNLAVDVDVTSVRFSQAAARAGDPRATGAPHCVRHLEADVHVVTVGGVSGQYQAHFGWQPGQAVELIPFPADDLNAGHSGDGVL